MKLEKEEYFSDDCIVEDNLYLGIKDMIICPLCNKILKEPYMCSECQNVYCKKCLEDYSNLKKCPKDEKNTKFIHSIAKNDLLSKLKYKCKNCLKEVVQTDIKAHLESNCESNNNNYESEKTLAEIIQTKKELIKLSKEEMKGKKIDKNITSKYIFKLFCFLKYSYNFRSFWSRENLSYWKVRKKYFIFIIII